MVDKDTSVAAGKATKFIKLLNIVLNSNYRLAETKQGNDVFTGKKTNN